MKSGRKRAVLTAFATLTAFLVFGCSDSDDAPPPPPPPPGPTILASGGSASSTGGEGGWINIETYSPAGVNLLETGSVDTGFSDPGYDPPVDLGTNGATVTMDTSVMTLTAGSGDPGSNVLYLVPGDAVLYAGDGAGTVPDNGEIVTGLAVDTGATLTLGLNVSTGGGGGLDGANLVFTDDVMIQGTLTTMDLTTTIIAPVDNRHGSTATSRDRGALEIAANQVFIRPGAMIDLTGMDGGAGTDERGGDGGSLLIIADNFFVNDGSVDNSGGDGDGIGIGGDACIATTGGNQLQIFIAAGYGVPNGGGVILNRGPLTSNGGDGVDGGLGCVVTLNANSFLYNTADITANGGMGTDGRAGDAGSAIEFISDYASINNSGNLSQVGGDGTTDGGVGGRVYLRSGRAGYVGDIVNSGDIDISAGNATLDGDGGFALQVEFDAHGGIYSSGYLTLNGGNAVSAGATSYIGGRGGDLSFHAQLPRDYETGNDLPVREIRISGNISLVGGGGSGGSDAGSGGNINVHQDHSGSVASEGGVFFLGYDFADLSGGEGTTAGGNAYFEPINIRNYIWSGPSGSTPSGPITNELDIYARGGNATASTNADGGTSGFLSWETDTGISAPGDVTFINNSGMIDLSGGDGATSGGDSGGLRFFGPGAVENSGNLLVQGGHSSDGDGGVGGFLGVSLVSGGSVLNSGEIRTTGGTGLSGGDAATGWPAVVGIIAGGQVSNSGPIYANGGNATGSTTDSPGSGGIVNLVSQSQPTLNSGMIIVAPGSGGDDSGSVGEIWIDFVDSTPSDGIL